ncbi:MAG TPA: NAD-dependent epimerase/dehydratase family protein [Croceibacterium sp.]|nr:NAD-dependent epimerase/dehydratase family protein [Croceibacterium sp.]
MTKVLVTGADGFIGRNLCVRLRERGGCQVVKLVRGDGPERLAEAAGIAEFVVHLAGVNRPQDPAEFASGNAGFTGELTAALAAAGNRAPVIYASSIQAERDSPYGNSKRAAEDALLRHAEATGAPVHLFRLANVFGKWARPNYNSAIATFCHNVAWKMPIDVHDTAAPLQLVYVDDVIDAFLALLDSSPAGAHFREAGPVYRTTVGDVADIIRAFPASRDTMVIPPVGSGLVRALYATYLSYLEPDGFAYSVPVHGREDPRGPFVEMLKTADSGQFSYFIARPGVTRGDHYHHTKSEKFLVIAGTAHFAFRHIESGRKHELVTRGGEGIIVETIPGWTHNITNAGEGDLVCMLWANEIFDRERPDTVAMKV